MLTKLTARWRIKATPVTTQQKRQKITHLGKKMVSWKKRKNSNTITN